MTIPDLAVVAALGLLEEVQVGIELLFIEVGGAVNALQLGAGRVGAPVGTRHLEQLDGLDEAGVGHVGPAAQIGEFALLVDGDGAFRQLLDHLELVGLVLVERQGLGLGDLPAANRELGFDQFLDLGLDAGEVLLRDRRHVDVVVEALFDHRADGELGLRVKPQDGLGHDVGRAVAHDRERLRVLRGDETHDRITVDARVQVHQPLVQLHRDTVAGQPFGDAHGHVQPGEGLLKILYVTIRKCYADHRRLFLWTRNMAIAPFALQGHAAPMGGPTGRQAFGIPMGSCYTDSSGSTTGAGGV
jgi:hypothetical protein